MPKKNHNKSQIITPGDTSPNFNFKELMGDDKFDIDTSFEKLEYQGPDDNIANCDESAKSHIKKHVSTPDNSILNEIKGPKHKVLINHIGSSVNSFLEDFKFMFYDQIFEKFYKEICDINEEKYKKKYEIFQKYQTQIAEMELMMRDDDNHQESIKVIIENLEEEKKEEVNKLTDEYEKLIEEKRLTFKNQSLRGAPALDTIQEKFKIDMLNVVNEVLYPSKYK
jgi:hypothetical protein